ncbi:MAG: MFS transporter [Haloarculaceae archaeon]
MRFEDSLRRRQWPTVLGYGLFVALLAAGYYYNVTLVQLGVLDLGTRLVGLSESAVSAWMAALALCTLVVAVATGVWMDRRGWTTDFRTKLRLLFAVVCVQFALTLVAPAIRSVPGFGAWIVAVSVGLGVGVPVSFSLTIDLVAVPDRGYVAAAITALAYLAANAVPLPWSIEAFSAVFVAAMAPGLVVLGVLAFGRFEPVESLVATLGTQHREFGTGRFCRSDPIRTTSPTFLAALALVFGVFFVDSLGFLRIVDTPALVLTAWQSPAYSTRLFIAGAHVVGAVMAGVIYVNFQLERVFLWTFALFALTHVAYTSDFRLAALFPSLSRGLASPLDPALYAVAVSFYTTLNFALWPDLSTARTVGTRAAIGVGVGGWLATFLSTALALSFQATDLPLLSHFNVVQALSLLLLFGVAAGTYLRRLTAHAREGEPA